MVNSPSFLRLNRMRILRKGSVAYDEQFHEGVNIIRGVNGSGKSTIADFIFFSLGGTFDKWKVVARQCDEVYVEVETPRGKVTLRREVVSAQEPVYVYFGGMSTACESEIEQWERFPTQRRSDRESFSQVMFRSLGIPEARSEGASNITIHQLLRLCYADQQTPAGRLFRFESFDTQSIREAVGDLICGIGDYEAFDLGLELRTLKAQLAEVEGKLKSLSDPLGISDTIDTPAHIQSQIRKLVSEREELTAQLNRIDEFVKPGEVQEYLSGREKERNRLISQKQRLQTLEDNISNIEFELREVNDYMALLAELKEKVVFAEATSETIGSIEFTRCPSCGRELEPNSESKCIVCSSPLDSEQEASKYNQIRFDLEIQMRESNQLVSAKETQLAEDKRKLRNLMRQHRKDLSDYGLKYSRGDGPREAFMGTRLNRLGRIDAEIEFKSRILETAEEIAHALEEKGKIKQEITASERRLTLIRRETNERRQLVLALISRLGADLLRSDLNRQEEFVEAPDLTVNFTNDSISVDGLVNFAESSNVILKNSALFALFLAACSDELFNHPRFLLIDNIEDKGMEELRSHLFQEAIVARSSETRMPNQVIFTTSMMNPELELDRYTIGPAYTSDQRALKLD